MPSQTGYLARQRHVGSLDPDCQSAVIYTDRRQYMPVLLSRSLVNHCSPATVICLTTNDWQWSQAEAGFTLLLTTL